MGATRQRDLTRLSIAGAENAAPHNGSVDFRQLDPIARRHGLALVVQFGSSVRGQTHGHSDCDIGVLFERVPDDIGASPM
jgi:predicted nucleotidyltransferase